MLGETTEGYKVLVSASQLRSGIGTGIFHSSNPYTVYNINIWIKLNRPEYELLSTEYTFNDELLLWRLKGREDLKPFKMTWVDFQQGYRHKKSEFEYILMNKRKSSLEKEIEDLLKIYNPEWELVSDPKNKKENYLFRNDEGYFSERNFTNLRLSKNKLSLFNKYFPETSMYNMHKYVNENFEDIILTPNQRYTEMKVNYKFICKYHGEFEAHWSNFYYREQGCPQCGNVQNSRGEAKIYSFLTINGYHFQTQYFFDDLLGCQNKRIRFDFCVFKNGKIHSLIEFQGEQHYKPVKWFGGEEMFKRQLENDKLKREYCNEIIIS